MQGFNFLCGLYHDLVSVYWAVPASDVRLYVKKSTKCRHNSWRLQTVYCNRANIFTVFVYGQYPASATSLLTCCINKQMKTTTLTGKMPQQASKQSLEITCFKTKHRSLYMKVCSWYGDRCSLSSLISRLGLKRDLEFLLTALSSFVLILQGESIF